MRRLRFTSLLALVAMMAACADGPTAPGTTLAPDGPAFATAEAGATSYLVVFNNEVPADFADRVGALGGTVVFTHGIGVGEVSGLDATGAAALQSTNGVHYVVRNEGLHLMEPDAVAAPVALEPTSQSDPATAILYSRQWNMRQIHADAAWASGRLGDPAVDVAILDTGIDYMLPDLAGRVDLSRSASFVSLDDDSAATYFPTRHASTDLHFHGTNVATQVASNAWAFAGVTSKVTLLSVKVCSFAGGCPGVGQGILYAVDQGAEVINMSLGGTFAKSDYPGAVSYYNRIMNYAKQNGVTVVVSAGNDRADLDHNGDFFSMYCDATNVLCVAATRRGGEPASYTNFGRSAIDVAAPGGDGATGDWVYALCPQTSLVFGCSGGYYILGVSGTSQAAPHVAGLAALAVEDVGRNPAKVRTYIRSSADPIENGTTPYYGKGLINVGAAVGAN